MYSTAFYILTSDTKPEGEEHVKNAENACIPMLTVTRMCIIAEMNISGKLDFHINFCHVFHLEEM